MYKHREKSRWSKGNGVGMKDGILIMGRNEQIRGAYGIQVRKDKCICAIVKSTYLCNKIIKVLTIRNGLNYRMISLGLSKS